MANTLEQIKKEILEMKNPLVELNGFKPVIVKTEYKKNKFNYGVQFWSDFLINKGRSQNSDFTWAYLVELV